MSTTFLTPRKLSRHKSLSLRLSSELQTPILFHLWRISLCGMQKLMLMFLQEQISSRWPRSSLHFRRASLPKGMLGEPASANLRTSLTTSQSRVKTSKLLRRKKLTTIKDSNIRALFPPKSNSSASLVEIRTR